MRRSKRVLVASTAMLVALSLSGCFEQETPDATSSPSPSQTPVFATEEEALAAATEAYEKYQTMSDLILSEGGRDPERIEGLAVGEALESARRSYSNFREKRWHSTGHLRSQVASLQKFDGLDERGGKEIVIAYVCVDVSDVDVLDKNEKSLVSPSRPDQQSFQAVFDLQDRSPATLILSSRVEWAGDGVCV